MDELYFDSKIIVVNKPAGILSQPDGKNTACVTDPYHKHESQKFPVSAHRLDRNTSGCQILVRNPKSAKKLQAMFVNGEIKKTYLIIVRGDLPKTGTINANLRKFEQKSYVDKRGKSATTNFTVLARNEKISLVEVQIETGRFHQIRAHFAHKRAPLLGDKKYGQGSSTRLFSRPAIHAWKIQVDGYQKDGANLQLIADPPDDFKSLMLKYKFEIE